MGVLTEDEARKVADSLWEIDWISASHGYMQCPGIGRHSLKDGPRDCKVHVMREGVYAPTIKCVHNSCAAEVFSANFLLRSALGKAETVDGWVPPARDWKPDEKPGAPAREEPPLYDREKLKEFAGEHAGTVDLAWLANRSVLDPARVGSAEFLKALYHPERGERVIVFQNEFSQGEAVWPEGKLPTRGKKGVWFLAQPVDGEYRPNPRSGRAGKGPSLSRRSEESVREWRFMVLESDEAPARLWMGALAQLPLRISAIYTSGGKSIHVLVRIDARLKNEWEESKMALKRGLVTLGADPASMSGVRLTRLPCCWREGKATRDGGYQKFDEAQYQKLLYINPDPLPVPLLEVIARRDVVAEVAKGLANAGPGMPLEELKALRYRAWFYTTACEKFAGAVDELDELIAIIEAPPGGAVEGRE